MIQIDIPMPTSCSECVFKDDIYACPLIPYIPAWVRDVNESNNRRSLYCPLIEVPEKKKWSMLESPESCNKCPNMMRWGFPIEKPFCHLAILKNSKNSEVDLCVDLDSKPSWCPIDEMNRELEELPPEKREKFDTLMSVLSGTFGFGG